MFLSTPRFLTCADKGQSGMHPGFLGDIVPSDDGHPPAVAPLVSIAYTAPLSTLEAQLRARQYRASSGPRAEVRQAAHSV